MYFPKAVSKCRVVKKVTDSGTFYCLKPATVVLTTSIEEPLAPLVICLDCARELAHEILESVPNGKRDSRITRRMTRRMVAIADESKAHA